MSFHVADLASLHVDPTGMPYYRCSFINEGDSLPPDLSATTNSGPMAIPESPDTGAPAVVSAGVGIQSSISISNPPILHSRPGCSKVLYLDFNGAIITNTAWNTSYSIAQWNCTPFSMDADSNNFSDAEQATITTIWQRVSEDYAPFDVDVTTEAPTNWTSTTGHALITPTSDAAGQHLPHYGSGGIAYVDVFGDYNYSYNIAGCYSPAFIKPMNGSSYADTAEAAAHELGHNLGLSHDGNIDIGPPLKTNEYYSGHGSGEISWAPIMGAGYGKNVSQWSKGEYYMPTQTQDDLAIISAKLTYRPDDYGDTNSSATLIVASNGVTLLSAGVITSTADVDVLGFAAGAGALALTVFPFRCVSGTYGGNLDAALRLFNSTGALVTASDPTNTTWANLSYVVPAAGTYYLYINGSSTGFPTNSTPTGYTSYGSIGQYMVSGKVALATGLIMQQPNGGEQWYRGGTSSVTWYTGTNTGNVMLQLYRGSTLARTLTNSVTNSGSYVWRITNSLIYATNYYLKVASLSQPSNWDISDGGFTLSTPDPFTENFDRAAAIPAGWSVSNVSGSAAWVFQTGGSTSGGSHPGSAHSTPYNACLADTSSSPDTNRLITPVINLSSYTGAVLRFWHYMETWSPDQDYLNIRVRTNAASPWVALATYTNSIAAWTQQSVTLPNPGSNYSIAFEGVARYGYGVCIDDVSVVGYPSEITTVTNNTPLWWLDDYGLPMTDAGALSDTDGDGALAWQEWVAGTVPTQSASVLRAACAPLSSTRRIVSWTPVAGRQYSVQWVTNLQYAFTNIAVSNTTGVYTDTVHSANSSGFYKLGVQYIQ